MGRRQCWPVEGRKSSTDLPARRYGDPPDTSRLSTHSGGPLTHPDRGTGGPREENRKQVSCRLEIL